MLEKLHETLKFLKMLPVLLVGRKWNTIHILIWADVSKSALDFVDRTQSRALKLKGDDRALSPPWVIQ